MVESPELSGIEGMNWKRDAIRVIKYFTVAGVLWILFMIIEKILVIISQ